MKEINFKKKFIIIILIIIIISINYFNKNKIYPNDYTKIDNTSTNVHIEYDNKELSGEWSEYAGKIILTENKIEIEGEGVTSKGNVVNINESGSYYITGNINDGNILIDAHKEEEVQLVLDNCSITSKSTAPINCINASKVIITLLDNSENILTDSSSYTILTDTESSEPESTIFSKTDLVINGNGKLIVNSNYCDGIVSKDGLKIINSEIVINAEDDGIKGKDYIAFNNAKINIVSKDDSIHSNGIIVLDEGSIKLASGDDGIHAEGSIIINKTNIDIIKCYEGIESSYIEINSGSISIISSDDGINIVEDDSLSNQNKEDLDLKLVINGGNIFVNAEGDGIDSNGSIYIYGGEIIIAGPTLGGNGPLDYMNDCIIMGGDIVIYGSRELWQNPSESSKQYSLSFKISGNAGDEIVLKDRQGKEIKTFETVKSYGALTISNEKIKKNKTYTLYVNGTKVN